MIEERITARLDRRSFSALPDCWSLSTPSKKRTSPGQKILSKRIRTLIIDDFPWHDLHKGNGPLPVNWNILKKSDVSHHMERHHVLPSRILRLLGLLAPSLKGSWSASRRNQKDTACRHHGSLPRIEKFASPPGSRRNWCTEWGIHGSSRYPDRKTTVAKNRPSRNHIWEFAQIMAGRKRESRATNGWHRPSVLTVDFIKLWKTVSASLD